MPANIPVRPKRTRPAQGSSPAQTAEIPAPPSHLSTESKAMWRSIAGEWVLGFDSLPLLQAACESWDSYQKLRASVQKRPTFTTKTGNMRANPAAKMANDALSQFRQCLRQLGLDPPKV